MKNFTIDANDYDETNLNKTMIRDLIRKHSSVASKIRKNQRYYDGKHKVQGRTKKIKGSSNNKVVCNHAKDISDTATGYFLSSAISFSTSDKKMNIDKLTDAFDLADVDDVDHDNALDMSVAGVAYEYVYVKENETTPVSKNLEPEHTFLVCDDTIEENILFGVYYYRFKDAVTGKYKYKATVGTENYIYDFEQQISLIDAYNTLMSDRVNDKEQFVEALLVVYGALMGDDEEEVSEVVKILKENGLLELPLDAKAEYIARTFDESGMEVLRKAIKEDIYTFSHVPNLTDENFVGNSSGVAMEYKLLGLEMITKTKERYYKKALKQRITLYCNYLNLKAISINPTAIIPTFSRGLPKNLLELSQIITNLKGFVSQETLLNQLDFVEDAQTEIKKVDEENDKAVERQQKMFGVADNVPFNNSGGEDDEEADGEDKNKNK